jgi:DNA-binding IclR family transcriptional regulator
LPERILAELAAANEGLTLVELAARMQMELAELASTDKDLVARDWVRGTPGGLRAITAAGRARLVESGKERGE